MENLPKINTTLLLIIKDGKILLGEKKRGFAKGVLIGIGGKQDPGETMEQAMIRETQEEIGVTPKNYEQVAHIVFNTWYKGVHSLLNLNIYSATDYIGEIQETDEIIPGWYDLDSIPYERMLEDDKLWMVEVLKGKKIDGKVVFNENLVMQSHEFNEVENFEGLEK